MFAGAFQNQQTCLNAHMPIRMPMNTRTITEMSKTKITSCTNSRDPEQPAVYAVSLEQQ